MLSQATSFADAPFRQERDDQRLRYEAISRDSRYGHYVRIPERICRCLDYFKISFNSGEVWARLHAYYLFIGVVDDLIDSSRPEAARKILKQLDNSESFLEEEAEESDARTTTEVFKRHIDLETYPAIVARLEELYQAVVNERRCRTMKAYVAQRKAIGGLTAEVSYLLIRPLLENEHKDLRGFLQKVGEVGCLVDSAIDLWADAGSGLLNFQPSFRDYLKLILQMLKDGLGILLKHTRLIGVFLEAIADNMLDFGFRRG